MMKLQGYEQGYEDNILIRVRTTLLIDAPEALVRKGRVEFEQDFTDATLLDFAETTIQELCELESVHPEVMIIHVTEDA